MPVLFYALWSYLLHLEICLKMNLLTPSLVHVKDLGKYCVAYPKMYTLPNQATILFPNFIFNKHHQ